MISKTIFGVKIKNVLAAFLFYAFFTMSYYLTLSYSQSDFNKDKPIFTMEDFTLRTIDYLLKFLLTIPIWFIIFKFFKQKSLKFRLLVHVFTLPIFVLLWQYCFYFVLDCFYKIELTGSGTIWDIYIPGLFYCIQFGILHGLEYYQDNVEQQKTQLQLRELSLKNELTALKSQLNPHFLYNVFNTINASVPKEQENTRLMIATLADMFRYQLKASQSDYVFLKHEINFVKQYLQLEKARFEDRLQVEWVISEEIFDIQIPPMIIQPLVENAIKHGIDHLIEGGKISISIEKFGSKIYFKIADTGVGIENKNDVLGKGIGLTNIKLILEKVYNATLKLSDNVPKGLIVEFEINIE